VEELEEQDHLQQELLHQVQVELDHQQVLQEVQYHMLEAEAQHLILDPLEEALVEQVVMDKQVVALLKMELPIEVAVVVE
jgi:hypothetical protein